MATPDIDRPYASAPATPWPLLAALALLLLGSGLLGSLLGIRAQLDGFGTRVTGVVLAFYYIGFVVGSRIAPKVVTQVGHIRVFAGLAALASTGALSHAVLVNPITWSLARAITGACIAGLYVVAESWLNSIATNEIRSRLLSLYMIVVMGAIGGGQLLLSLGDPASFNLFILAGALLSLAVVPVSLAAVPSPAFSVPEPMQLRQLWHKAPVGVGGGLGTGVANGAIFAMTPVYGIATGMSVVEISILMLVMIAGAVTLQMPIGLWSNHVRRRRSILVVNLIAALAAAGVAGLEAGGLPQLAVAFVLGGTTFPAYSLNLSHVNDVLEPAQTVSASSLFVLVTGIGSVLGPIFASLLMAGTNPAALFWFIGAVHAAVALFVAARITVREAPPVARQRPYLPVPARASALVGVLAKPRRNRRNHRRGYPSA